MNRLVSVESLNPSEVSSRQYAAYLATVGYEQRARFVSCSLKPKATRRTACAFPHRHGCAFDDNLHWFSESGFDVPVVKDQDAEEWSRSWLADALEATGGEARIAIDVSSTSRLRLASIVAALMTVERAASLSVEFLYAMAKWSAPSDEPEPIISAGAVLPCFAGWSSDPDSPIVAVVGLGYEPGKAVGVYEYLEATKVWTFVPTSGDPLYTRDVMHANESLLRRVSRRQQVTYEVTQPLACFGALESVVYGILDEGRPVLIPFGPKVFALCALLVSCVHRNVPVWRISSGEYGPAIDRLPSGDVVGLRVTFEPAASDCVPG